MKLISKNSTGNYREYEHNRESILYFYDVAVATKIPNVGTYLDEQYWDYSRTTVKHITTFLNTDSRKLRKMIKDGIITLKNLN